MLTAEVPAQGSRAMDSGSASDAGMKRKNCKNRNDIAGQSIVCLGNTTVQMLQKLKACMPETRHAPESFPDRVIFASMFKRHHQQGKSGGAKQISS